MFDNDVPRYRKKSNKNTPPKADHKHVKEDCVFFIPVPHYDRGLAFGVRYVDEPCLGSYCPICGKVMVLDYLWCDQEKKDKIEKALKKLPIFHLDDIFQKFIGKK